MSNANLDDIQVIEIPDDAVIVTRESALAPAADPAPSPMDTIMRFKFFVIALLVIAGIVSAWPLRQVFSSPDTYAATIATLDEKKANVLAMVAASTTASVAITAVPDDVGTPIAEKLMDLSSNLMLITAIIYLEKYLPTISGSRHLASSSRWRCSASSCRSCYTTAPLPVGRSRASRAS